MAEHSEPRPRDFLLTAADIAALPEGRRQHPFNANAVDAVHYPRIRRTLLKAHGARRWVDWSDLHDSAG